MAMVGAIPNIGGMIQRMPGVMNANAQSEEDMALQQLLSSMGEVAPKPRSFGIADAIPLAIAGLIGHLAGVNNQELNNFGTSYVGAASGVKDRQSQYKEDQYRKRREIAQFLYQQRMAKAGRLRDTADKMQSRQWQLADRAAANAMEAAKDQAKAREQEVSNARMRYDGANLPSEKIRAAAVLRSLDPQFAPTKEQVDEDIRALQAGRLESASRQLQQEIYNIDRGRGLVDEANGAALEGRAQAIAKAYGIDRNQLPIVPTGTTLQKQHYDQLKSQFDQTFKFRSDAFKTTTAQAWARIEVARKQLEIAREGLGLRAGGLDLSERRFQYQINKDAGLILGASTKELTKARHDLAVEQAKLDQIKGRNPATFGVNMQDEATRKQAEKVQEMQDEVAALEQLQRMAGEDAGDSQPPQGDSGSVEALPGDGSFKPAKVGGLPPGPIGGKTPGRSKPAPSRPPSPKGKPKASAPKGQEVYSQGGVTVRRRT